MKIQSVFKNKRGWLFGFIGTLLLSSGYAATKNTDAWRVNMRSLGETLGAIAIDVSSNDRFDSKAGKARVDANAKKLANLAKHVSQHQVNAPDSDPTLSIVATLFEGEANRAQQELKRGNRVYARSILRSMSGYCIGCHSRTTPNPTFPSYSLFAPNSALQKEIAGLSKVDQANLLSATRQFDDALGLYEAVLKEQLIPAQNIFMWEAVSRNALAIAVRVKKDPDRAMSIVETLLAAKKAPFFLRENASAWKESLTQWKAEGGRELKTEDGAFAEAVRLLNIAKNSQNYPADHGADVAYLRATSVLHDLLKTFSGGKHAADSYLFLGVAYEALGSLSLGDIADIYYQACIYKSPRSETARSCFRNYEASVYRGYTGTAGASLPPDVNLRLQKLQQLANGSAEPEKGTSTP